MIVLETVVPFCVTFAFQNSEFRESRFLHQIFTPPLFSHFVTNLDWLAGQPIQIFLTCQILDPDFQISFHFILAPWMPIAKPEVASDTLGVFPTTETTSSLKKSSIGDKQYLDYL